MGASGHRLIILAALAAAAAGIGATRLEAAQRDCQTIVTCRFTSGGSYRGCLSSYSCRQCRFVPARCVIGGKSGTCQKIRCNWGA
jgi:hypothetical protein